MEWLAKVMKVLQPGPRLKKKTGESLRKFVNQIWAPIFQAQSETVVYLAERKVLIVLKRGVGKLNLATSLHEGE